jgi:sortase A
MKVIHPGNDDEKTVSNHLNEGEEISLGIEPKPQMQPQVSTDEEAIESADADKLESEEFHVIKRIHQGPSNSQKNIAPHAQDDLMNSVSNSDVTQDKSRLDVEVENYPMIDLTPGAEHSSGHGGSDKKTARQKLSELRKHKHWHNAKLIIATVLVFLLIFNSQWFISQFMYLFNKPKPQIPAQQNQSSEQQEKKVDAEVVGPQNEIIIPKIGVTAPLVFINTTNEPDVLIALRDGVVHYYGTAMPGENGNAAFFGHSSNDWWESGNYKFVFVLLEKLSVGDVYEIHYNSRKYVYQVTQTKVVQPNDLSVLNQTSEPTSTLITCTPPGTSWQRFVVTGKQISPVVEKPAQTETIKNNATAPSQNTSKQTLPSAAPSIWQQIADFFASLFGQKKVPNTQQDSSQDAKNQHLPEVN